MFEADDRHVSCREACDLPWMKCVLGHSLVFVSLTVAALATTLLSRAIEPMPFAWLPIGIAAGLVLRLGWAFAFSAGLASGPWLLAHQEVFTTPPNSAELILACLLISAATIIGLVSLRIIMRGEGQELARGRVTLQSSIRLLGLGLPTMIAPLLAAWFVIKAWTDGGPGDDGPAAAMAFILLPVLGLLAAIPATVALLPNGKGGLTYTGPVKRVFRIAPGLLLLLGTVIATWWASDDTGRTAHLTFDIAIIVSAMWLIAHSGWLAVSIATLLVAFSNASHAFGSVELLVPIMGFLIMFAASMEQRFRETSIIDDKNVELDSLLNATGAAMIELDRDGEVLFWNDAAAQLHARFNQSGPDRRGIIEALDARSRRRLETTAGIAMTGRRRECEVAIQSKDENRIMCLAMCSPLHDSSRRVRGCSIVVLDLTSSQRRERSRRRRQDRDFESLANALIHDVNNFAMAVGGAVTLAREKNGGHLGDVLNGIEDSCIETARRTQRIRHSVPNREQGRIVDLGLLASERLRRHHRQGRIAIAGMICDPGTIVDVPESFTDFIVDEVISNAIDAQAMGCPEIALSCQRNQAGEVELKIGDNGPGIPAAIEDRIGTAFVTTKGGGRGLGLRAIASSVRAAGGRLQIKSSSRGTVLSITLPLITPHRGRHPLVVVSSPRETLRTTA